MRTTARPLSLVVAAVLVASSACSPEGAPDVPAPAITEPSVRGLQPYAYTSPVPPLEPTELDGTYRRKLSIAQAGGKPVACRRCAPYRLDAGTTLLIFEQGRFFLVFRPVALGDVCPRCKPPGSFRASGHFTIDGNQLDIFNDPNCEEVRGSYRWEMNGDMLAFEAISDPCFGGIRDRFLGARPWRAP